MFDYVTEQRLVPGKTVELVLNQLRVLGEHPVLVVEHLGETNTAFWQDAIAKAGARAATEARAQVSATVIAQNRLDNREIVAKHAVRATRGFYHAGKDRLPDRSQPATDADIPAIVAALPDDVFDSVLAFVRNEQNFRETAPLGDPKTIAGK